MMDVHIIETRKSEGGVTYAVPVSTKNAYRCNLCNKILKDVSAQQDV